MNWAQTSPSPRKKKWEKWVSSSGVSERNLFVVGIIIIFTSVSLFQTATKNVDGDVISKDVNQSVRVAFTVYVST